MSANRLERAVLDLASRGACGVAPYVTAGDGGLARTLLVLEALERAGAACIELGVPFSDPIADGPVLQAAAQRALDAGTTLDGVLDLVRSYRARGGALPLLAFTYANPLFRRGVERATGLLADAGLDGLLVPDLPVEESGALFDAARARGLAPVAFVTPTTSDERVRAADRASRGFVYVIGRVGITGARTELDDATVAHLARMRALCERPLGVGFGLSTADQVRAVAPHAALAIVGTALVRHVHTAATSAEGAPDEAAARAAGEFVAGLGR